MGLGQFGGGLATARYLAEHGARVTITDHASAESLKKSLQQLNDLPIRNIFCGHHPDEAFDHCELLVVNPAVRPDHPVLARCETEGIPVATEIQLLLQHLQAKHATTTEQAADKSQSFPQIVAVTGSNGKSTTSALIHHLLSYEFAQQVPGTGTNKRTCWLGGNIGRSLLPVADQIQPCDVVVLELSSFQLYYLQDFAFTPDVAVLTEFSANHLDWHPNLDHYHAAKQNLFRKQFRSQSAVVPGDHQIEGQHVLSLPEDDEEQCPMWRVRSRPLRFGIVDDGQDGVFWEEETLVVRNAAIDDHGVEDAIRVSLPTSLAGQHNLKNLTAAACAAIRCGADPIRFSESVPGFRGLPFRMALAGQKGSIRWINDSASTTPKSTIAALKTFRKQLHRQSLHNDDRLVAIVGGRDKGGDSSQLIETLKLDVDGVVLIGDIAESLATMINHDQDNSRLAVSIARDFPDAMGRAVELVGQAGIVVFSPGYSSFGWFQDYVDRGQQFDLLVQQWIQK